MNNIGKHLGPQEGKIHSKRIHRRREILADYPLLLQSYFLLAHLFRYSKHQSYRNFNDTTNEIFLYFFEDLNFIVMSFGLL